MIRQLRLLELYYQVHLEDDNRYWVTAKEDLALTEMFSVVFSSLGVLRMLNKKNKDEIKLIYTDTELYSFRERIPAEF